MLMSGWGGGRGELDEGLKTSTEGAWPTSREAVPATDSEWEEWFLSVRRPAGGKMVGERVGLTWRTDWRTERCGRRGGGRLSVSVLMRPWWYLQ